MFLRNTVFGVEDSLVSTVGLLSGIAATGSVSKSFILLTGIVYISVEAFSMAVGSFLSEEFVEEYEHKKEAYLQPALGAFIMFASFALAGFVPILPYLFFAGQQAILISVIASIIALFLLGMAGGHLSRIGIISRGLRMGLLGGSAIVIGIVVGSFFNIE